MKEQFAFARPHSWIDRDLNGECIGQNGMTIRQWYKGMALTASDFREGMTGDWVSLAKMCGEIADRMIKEDEDYLKGIQNGK